MKKIHLRVDQDDELIPELTLKTHQFPFQSFGER